MTSDRTTLLRLIALCLALAPLPGAFAYSETDLATLSNTGSCAGCDLTGADLYEANLYQADLSGADLTDADLTAADLTLADLSGADLRGAILEEANLSGTNLAGALLDQHALAGAVFDSERTRGTLGFKELKLGMNVVEIAQYCSITNIDGNASDLANLITARTEKLLGHCLDDADMPFAFGFSGIGSNGVLNSLEVGIAAYTEENHRKFIDLLEKKYKPMRSYSAADVAAFNKDRSLEGQSLDTIFANGQVTLSVVSRGTGLQLLLTYRAEDNGQRFLDRKGGPAPVDLTQLPAVTTDLYKLVGNYSLKGIAAKGTSANHGRIDTAYLEIDAFENELAGELAISGTRMNGRFQITRVEKVSSRHLIVELEPVEGTIPDGRPLRMSIKFSEDGDSFTGKWTNWFRLQNAKSRRPDDFVGVRSQSFWQTVMTHNRSDMYQAYLRLHPGGIYTAAARDRLAALGGVVPTPSSPTVSAAATVSADTPATPSATTVTTAPVDPLVGIWRWRSHHTHLTDECYLGVGITNDGTFKAKGWESIRNDMVDPSERIIGLTQGRAMIGVRDIAITRNGDQTYSWESDQSLRAFDGQVGAPHMIRRADMGGQLSVATETTSLYANSRVCRKTAQESKSSTYEKLSLEEALALELPPELLAGFPSPFATEGPQVASVPKATAATPATPSAATATTTPVDPLVGIWKFSQADGTLWGFLIVGINDKGGLAGFQWQYVHSENFGFRETTIKPLANGSYSWRSDKPVSLVNPSFAIDDSAKEGKFWFSESESGLPTITSSKELFAQWPGLPPRQPLNKLSHEEALALELPPQVPHDFPSPFATEGQQVASVPEAAASASTSTSTPATTTATTTQLIRWWGFGCAPARTLRGPMNAGSWSVKLKTGFLSVKHRIRHDSIEGISLTKGKTFIFRTGTLLA